MRFETVGDIYDANTLTREKLIELLASVSGREAAEPADGKWSIQKIAEHIAMVDEGTARICQKLVEKAVVEGRPFDGRVSMTPEFGSRSAEIAAMKVEAPDIVQPTGDVTIDQAVARLCASREAFASLRPDIERFDCSGPKFPHPFFGQLTAVEWLMVAGGHEARHAKQIERLLSDIRN